MGELDEFLKQEGFSVEVSAREALALRREAADGSGHSLQKMQAHRRASAGFSKAAVRKLSRRPSLSKDTMPLMTSPSLEADPASGSNETTPGSPIITNRASTSNWSVRVASNAGARQTDPLLPALAPTAASSDFKFTARRRVTLGPRAAQTGLSIEFTPQGASL